MELTISKILFCGNPINIKILEENQIIPLFIFNVLNIEKKYETTMKKSRNVQGTTYTLISVQIDFIQNM